jgi:hypothetical protein
VRESSKCLCTRSVLKRVSVYFHLLDRINYTLDFAVYSLSLILAVRFLVVAISLTEPVSSLILLFKLISVLTWFRIISMQDLHGSRLQILGPRSIQGHRILFHQNPDVKNANGENSWWIWSVVLCGICLRLVLYVCVDISETHTALSFSGSKCDPSKKISKWKTLDFSIVECD